MGTISLSDYIASKVAGTPATFEVLQKGSVVETHTAMLEAGGRYNFETSFEGQAEIRVKVAHWLAKTQNFFPYRLTKI